MYEWKKRCEWKKRWEWREKCEWRKSWEWRERKSEGGAVIVYHLNIVFCAHKQITHYSRTEMY